MNAKPVREKPTVLEVIQGGLEPELQLATAPKGPGGNDWLRDLPKDARFLARAKIHRGVWLDQYGVAFVIPEAILLAAQGETGIAFRWVDSQKFSNENIFVALLPNPTQEEGNNEHHLLGPADSEDNDGHEGTT